MGRKFFEIRCSEIASEAILDRSRAVVPTWSKKYCTQFFGCHIHAHLLSKLTVNFHERK